MRRTWLVSLLVAAVGFTATACGDDDTAGEATAGAAAEDGTPETVRLAYDLAASSRGGFSWDPSQATATTSDVGLYHWVYGGLMRLAPDGSLVPDLAERATVVDQNTVEVVLRDGITWPDGTRLGAEHVKAALDHNLSLTDAAAFDAGFFALSSVDVVDEKTVRLTISDGTAAGWRDTFLAGPETLIVPPDTDFGQPGGAGPFRVTDYQPGEGAILEKNPDYWDAESIPVQRIQLVNTPDTQAATAALNAGQVDWASIQLANRDAVQSGHEIEMASDPNQLAHFTICKETEPFSDPKVRRALSMAIDRAAINDAVFGGTGEPAWGLWPEDHRFHNPATTGQYAYDPDAARELLAEAGYPDGFTFDAIPLQSSGMPEVTQIVQQQYADVGVTMNIDLSSDYVQDYVIDNKAPIGVSPLDAPSDRAKLRRWVGDSFANTCEYHDPELEQLAEDLASVTSESDEAVEVWHQIDEKAVDDALSIFIAFHPRVVAYNPERLSGVAISAYAIDVPEVRDLEITGSTQ